MQRRPLGMSCNLDPWELGAVRLGIDMGGTKAAVQVLVVTGVELVVTGGGLARARAALLPGLPDLRAVAG